MAVAENPESQSDTPLYIANKFIDDYLYVYMYNDTYQSVYREQLFVFFLFH